MDDKKIEKYMKNLLDPKYIDSITADEKLSVETIILNIPGKPESYSRERKGRGGFYNPKSKKMLDIRKSLIKQLSDDQLKYTRDLINDKDKRYHIELTINYYIGIPKNTSIKDMVKMKLGWIKPTTRPDLDNYGKFILDTLHDVLYDDDKRVVRTEESKEYSLEPRTEIIAMIYSIDKK